MEMSATLDADHSIIVLADLQPEIVAAGNRTNHDADLRRAAKILVDAANALGIPIFRSGLALEPGAVSRTIEELGNEPVVARSTPGVFDHDASRKAIAAHPRSIVAVGGVSSEVAVLHSALGALREGHAVHILTDLCGGFSERTERAAFRQMEAAGAKLSSVASFFTGYVRSFDESRAQHVLAAMSRLWS